MAPKKPPKKAESIRTRKIEMPVENDVSPNQAECSFKSQDGLRRSYRIRNDLHKSKLPTKRSADVGDPGEPLTKKSVGREQGGSSKMVNTRKSTSSGKKTEKKTFKEKKDQRVTKKVNVERKVAEPKFYFDRLPPQVMDMIFSELAWYNGEYDLRYRLVCKSWNKKCSRKKTITFYDSERIEKCGSECFKNIGFECLELEFKWFTYGESLDLNVMPRGVWEKIGTKVQSLDLIYCDLGGDVLRNIILHCDNLQSLDLKLRRGDLAHTFCTLSTLKSLKVVREKLTAFGIETTVQDAVWGPPYIKNDFQKWYRIFMNLIRIFPNVTNYSSGHNGDGVKYFGRDGKWFKCEFSMERDGAIDESSLASCLAHSLSGNEKSWKNALDSLSKLNLKSIILNFPRSRFNAEDITALSNLFSNQKKLTLLSVQLEQLKSNIDKEMLKNLLLTVVNNCRELRQLNFCYKAGESILNWLNNLSSYTLPLKLEELAIGSLSIDSFTLNYCSEHLYDGEQDCWKSDPTLLNWIPKYCHISKLTLTETVSDEFLQCVFQYMTGLKVLAINLERLNTDFGLTGRCDDIAANSAAGYSIKRLQNLETLEIKWVSYAPPSERRSWTAEDLQEISRSESLTITDGVFNEFDFPNLRYFSCFPPKELSVLANVAVKMPSLRKIKLDRTSLSSNSLVDFCRRTGNLYTMEVVEGNFDINEVKAIFNVCPSLHYLYTKSNIDYFEPFTKEVRRVPRPKNWN